MAQKMPIVALSEMIDGQEADVFVLLTGKEEAYTRDGKPYWRVTFQDRDLKVDVPIWNDSVYFRNAQNDWTAGHFYKLRATFRETDYGKQLELHKIREVDPERDTADGFDPALLRPGSPFDPQALYQDLLNLAEHQIQNAPLRELVVGLLARYQSQLLELPATLRAHYAYAGGLLEHTRSVTTIARGLTDYYVGYYAKVYPRRAAPVDRDLVIAGAILHDIGKVRELAQAQEGAVLSPAGALVGHTLQGRDMIREAADGLGVDAELLLRLEHIIVSHQRPPENRFFQDTDPHKPAMTPEALLVQHANDLDTRFYLLNQILRQDATPGPLTGPRNPLGHILYRGAWPAVMDDAHQEDSEEPPED